MPFDQVSVLEVDGQMIAQEYAISKFLARQFGFCSKDNMEHAREDMYVFLSEDLCGEVEPLFFEKDKDKLAVMMKKFVEQTGPNILSRLETALGNCTSGYLLGDKISWADMAVFSNVGAMEYIIPNESVTLLKAYPKLTKHLDLVRSHPNISAYLKKRPTP
ncbi:glutathione S-transferase 1-like [Liolophura sinensis]|uniref:glutathione S-transferase 1-like n=1 Tax=Liolophura sinensis TaxID=3198878 RepID=UPI003158320A